MSQIERDHRPDRRAGAAGSDLVRRAAGRLGLAGRRATEALRDRPLYAGRGAPLTVSRTGFTGDLGYELWMDPAAAEEVWDALMAAGRTRGIRAIGSQALNMARIEAGFVMPNLDFVSAEHTIRTGRDRSPDRTRALAGWSISRKVTSPAAARCWRASARRRGASWSGSTSRATSRRTMRCCTPRRTASARSAA